MIMLFLVSLGENYSALGFLRFPFGPGTDPLFPSSKGIESDFFMIPFGYGNKIMIPWPEGNRRKKLGMIPFIDGNRVLIP